MDEGALLRLQTVWNHPQQKDEFSVCLNDLERDYRQDTEVGRMGGYSFQGAIFGVDGSCKDSKMGAGCCRFQGAAVDKCTRVGRRDESTSSNRPELGRVVLALQTATLSEDVLLLRDNEAVYCFVITQQ